MSTRTQRRRYFLHETFPIRDASADFIRAGGLGLDEMVSKVLDQAGRRGNRIDLDSLSVTVQAEPLKNSTGPLVLAVHARVDAIATFH